jgi:PEP-CTERM motif-containing protein
MSKSASARRSVFAIFAVALLFCAAQSSFGAVIGAFVVVKSDGEVFATYRGNSANFSNDLYLASPDSLYSTNIIFNNHASPVGLVVDLGFFTAGTELKFRLHVNDTGNDWFTGPGSRNGDGLPHARITDQWSPNESLVEFEDLAGLPEGNNGFNDLSFSFTNTTGTVSLPVPEPGTYAMLAAGVLMLLAVQRSRRTML